ncbi:hypothetical protein HGRIS_008323 [Hohenbuehelia grisea]|uniref:Fork-head domain-containing protein n=1 Tax=Hohenbuehelia grisea TaxID=104357 RepID=A0ABR3J825_9AGAR
MSTLQKLLNTDHNMSDGPHSRLLQNNHQTNQDTSLPSAGPEFVLYDGTASARLLPNLSPDFSTSEDVLIPNSRPLTNLSSHESHPDCPNNFSCLPDTDGRPQHTLPVILRCAILGSPHQRLTIREIYAAMESKYPYYRTAGQTWKQSVRHHLSLNRLFERQPRPVTDPGFGSYWTVNLAAPPGTKRPRKRGRPKSEGKDAEEAPLKKRGRPRKEPVPTVLSTGDTGDDGFDELDETSDEEGDVPGRGYEDDVDSEDEVMPPFDRHSFVSGNRIGLFEPHRPLAERHAGHFSRYESTDHIIDRLQIEMFNLRRQQAEASSQLSDQLAQAQAEAVRARAALRITENMLEDESRKRREAERYAEDESRRRRAMEEELRSYRTRSPPHTQSPTASFRCQHT